MTKTAKVYETITNRIVALLEEGTVPWRKPWSVNGTHAAPKNLISMKAYRGINAVVLGMEQAIGGYSTNYWLTFNQARTLGGSVRKGEKGSPIVLYKKMSKEDAKTGKDKSWMMAKQWTVFNLDQVDATEGKLAKLKEMAKPEPKPETDRIEACEAIVSGYVGPEYTETNSARAYYQPSTDTINVPPLAGFESAESYYGTRFHEMAHSTGHKSRLDRGGVTNTVMFGDHRYANEELVAELASAMLCGVAGIAPATIEQSAAYCKGWASRLKGDATAIVKAASAAQKAADLILGTAPATDLK